MAALSYLVNVQYSFFQLFILRSWVDPDFGDEEHTDAEEGQALYERAEADNVQDEVEENVRRPGVSRSNIGQKEDLVAENGIEMEELVPLTANP